MADIRYVFGNLKTNKVVDEFSLQGVSMSDKLNGWGTLRGSFGLDQSGHDNIDLVGATIPGECYVAVERTSSTGEVQVVWFGLIWSQSYQAQAKVMQISARSLAAYPEKRIVFDFLEYVNVDQGTIFLDLWDKLLHAGLAAGDIGINLPPSFPTGVLKNLSTKEADFRRMADVLSSLADSSDGFDWKISVAKDGNGRYVKTLETGYPALGNTDPALLTFDYPGNIFNYYRTGSITNAGNTVYVTGGQKEEGILNGVYNHFDQLSSGQWPWLEVVVPRSDVESATRLQGLAAQEATLRRPPMSTYKVFVRGDATPEFGSYSLGDACRLAIVDPLHPYPGLSVDTRITSWNYKPTSDDTVEEVELIFEGDELNQD
jgi:hypothetical protein